MDDPWSRWIDEPPYAAPAPTPVLRPGADPAAAARQSGRLGRACHPPEHPRLLVVAPKPSARELGGVLRVWGYEPITLESVANARAMARQEQVDAALVDVDLTPVAYDLVWQLNELERPCRSVLIGRGIDPATMREAFLVGVIACLAKPIVVDMLGQALRLAVEGSMVARACMAPRPSWATRSPESPSLADRLSVLTLREQEVLDQLLAGASTKAMAATLGITPRTVKYHVTNILTKLGEDSRMSLLARLRSDLARQQR